MKKLLFVYSLVITFLIIPSKSFSQWGIRGGASLIKKISFSKLDTTINPIMPGIDLNVVWVSDNSSLVSFGGHISSNTKDSSLILVEENSTLFQSGSEYRKLFASRSNYKNIQLKWAYNLSSHLNEFKMIYAGWGVSYIRIATSYIVDKSDPNQYNVRDDLGKEINITSYKDVEHNLCFMAFLGAMYELEHFRVFGELDIQPAPFDGLDIYLAMNAGIFYPF